jgi:O-antigen/teichoic acid export membrane protein
MAIGASANLFSTAIAVRMLSQETYGQFSLLMASVTVLLGIATAGLGTAITRSLSATTETFNQEASLVIRGSIAMILVLSSLGSIVILAGTYIMLDGVGRSTRLGIGLSMSVFLLGSTAVWTSAQLNRALGHLVATVVPGIIQTSLRALLLFAIFQSGAGDLISIAGIHGLVGLTILGIVWILVIPRVRLASATLHPSIGALGQLVRHSYPYALHGFALLMVSRLDVLFLGVIRGSTEVGEYEPVLRIIEAALQTTALVLMTQFVPIGARLAARNHRQDLEDLWESTLKLNLIFCLLPAMILTLFSGPVFQGLFGGRFVPPPGVIVLLVVSMTLYGPGYLGWGLMAALGDTRNILRIGISVLAAAGGCGWAFISLWGARGAAIATGTCVVLHVVMTLSALHNHHGMRVLSRRLSLIVGTSPLPYCASLALRSLLGKPTLLASIAIPTISWVLWVAALYQLRLLGRREIRDFVSVRSR